MPTTQGAIASPIRAFAEPSCIPSTIPNMTVVAETAMTQIGNILGLASHTICSSGSSHGDQSNGALTPSPPPPLRHAPPAGSAPEDPSRPCAPPPPSRPAPGSRERLMSSASSPSISTPRFIGPGCMTMASSLAMRELLGVQAVTVVIFALGRDEAAVHAFLLEPQHHHHVARPSALRVMSSIDLAPKLGDPCGHQCRRARSGGRGFPSCPAAGCSTAPRGYGRCRRRSRRTDGGADPWRAGS